MLIYFYLKYQNVGFSTSGSMMASICVSDCFEEQRWNKAFVLPILGCSCPGRTKRKHAKETTMSAGQWRPIKESRKRNYKLAGLHLQ